MLPQESLYVNTVHIELFYHALEDNEWLDSKMQKSRSSILKHVFAHPFLLNEILAISALHLSTLRLAKSLSYRSEATRLHSEALRLFNETIRTLSKDNIVAVFLFSGLFGIATFFETFHNESDGMKPEMGPSCLLEKIVQSTRLLQSVRSMVKVDGWWEFLKNSDIRDFLVIESSIDDAILDLELRYEVVDQLQAFRNDTSQRRCLNNIEKLVYDEAIAKLLEVYQTAFGNGDKVPLDDHVAKKYAIRWLILVPLTYTELLAQRKPEALVILGHFSVVLHKLKSCWTVGNSGSQLLKVVDSHLGEGWQGLLKWPKAFIERP